MTVGLLIGACCVVLVLGFVLFMSVTNRRSTFARKGAWTRFCAVGRDCQLSEEAGQFVVTAFDSNENILCRRRFADRNQTISFAQFLFGQSRLGDVTRHEDSQTNLVLVCKSQRGRKKQQATRVEITAKKWRPAKATLWVVKPSSARGLERLPPQIIKKPQSRR
ncbi:hypothetical protein PH7735_02207 [Shimia thalassica]|uniref:Uncharacterized protein n=1 Tax=Shimia thalassica TaxID=1715693 RepID=A0A0P1I9G8_9RHOB|nr:hypothetical protein [Shimia thalassica]CUJ99463.1 hypothetical protein PH7735_02207 [Shimia thalassica]